MTVKKYPLVMLSNVISSHEWCSLKKAVEQRTALTICVNIRPCPEASPFIPTLLGRLSFF